MTFNWQKCNKCDRKYLDEMKHNARYHEIDETLTTMIPIEHNDEVKELLRRGKIQVVKQKPELLVRITPFVHHEVDVGDDITLEIGKTYKVEERKQ